jgi:glycosyltransferase involved in cell wall biosynthesis
MAEVNSGQNILFISKTSIIADAGGAELRVKRFAEEFSKSGHQVAVVSGKTSPNIDDNDNIPGVRIEHIDTIPQILFKFNQFSFYLSRYMFPFVLFPWLLKELYSNEYDTIIECMTPYPTTAIFVSIFFDVDHIAEIHGYFDKSSFYRYDPLTVAIQLVVQNFVRIFSYDLVVVPSEHLKFKYTDYGVPSSRLQVIPNGVDFYQYQAIDPSQNSDQLELLTLSRMSKGKRVEDLLDVIYILEEKYDNNLLFHVAGDGPHLSNLKKTCDHKGLNDIIKFHGYVSGTEKIKLYKNSDIFLYASDSESFGIVLLEAMAAGLPIVARHLNVYEQFFEAGYNGILIDDCNDFPTVMADNIVEIYNSNTLFKKIKKNNVQTAKNHDWNKIAQKYMSKIHSLNIE